MQCRIPLQYLSKEAGKLTKIPLVLAVSIVLSAPAGACFAQGAAPPPGAPANRPVVAPKPCIVTSLRLLNPRVMHVLNDRLKLSAEQEPKVRDLLTKSEEAAKPLVEAHRKAAEEYVMLLVKPGANQADIIAAAERASKVEAAIVAEQVKTLFALRALLNGEQNSQLNTLIDGQTTIWKTQGPGSTVRAPGGAPALTTDSKPAK